MEDGEDAVALGVGLIEVAGFEGGAMALLGFAGIGAEGEVEPPDSVVVPEVVVGVGGGAAGGEGVGGLGSGHGSSVVKFLFVPGGAATSRDPGTQTPAPMGIDAGVRRNSVETFVEWVCLIPAPHLGKWMSPIGDMCIKSSFGHFLSLSSLGDFHIPPP